MPRFKRLPKRRTILWLLNIFITLPVLAAMAEAILLTSPPRFYAEKKPADFGMNAYQNVQFRTADALLLSAWYIAPGHPNANLMQLVQNITIIAN